ncbi:MAG: hypothetical protein RLZZ461_1754 [Planctomycetota bacterium]|jgi:hypothetical protein
MQARPRFITTLLAISASALVVGCGETSDTEDPLAAVSEQYRKVLRERPVIREQADATDDTAESLRQLASRAQSAGRDGNEQAAAILTAGIRSSAATLDYDEAMRAESQAAVLRDQVRALAADADRLATAAMSAEQFDIGETTIVLESELARARESFNAADSELEELRSQTELAASERDEFLAFASEFDATANESAEIAVELNPMEARDYWIDAAHFRSEAHKARVAAALSEISIQTIAPTMTLADTRRSGQSEVIDAAREARRAAENRVDEAQSFASEVRDLVDQLATAATERLARVEQLETTEIMPRLEASIADFEAAASAARALTRGGSREESAAGWRAIANAQFGAGRAQWDIATIQGRRADLFGRLAVGGVLADAGSAGRAAEAAFEARKSALEAAETAFNEALSSLGNIQGDDATATMTRATIERAISGVKGETMAPPPTARTAAAPSSGGSSVASSSGTGFGTPAELANALSSMNPADTTRIAQAIQAKSDVARGLQKALSGGDVMSPLMDALAEAFPDFDPSEMADAAGMPGMGGGAAFGFSVKSVEGDSAKISDSNNTMTFVAARTGNGWIIDLDASMEADPNLKMMAQMMGPMLEQMQKPMKQAAADVAARVRAGEFSSANEAMMAFAELLEASLPSMPGFGGGGGGGFGGF